MSYTVTDYLDVNCRKWKWKSVGALTDGSLQVGAFGLSDRIKHLVHGESEKFINVFHESCIKRGGLF